jgi:group I intron endonuclease
MKKGDKFGMLTLIEKTSAPNDNKRKGTFWLCQCDCGNMKIAHQSDLRANDTKSCGCLKKRKPIYDKNKREISNHAGIYLFQNIYNGHCYVGKAVNLYNRYCDHRSDWKKNKQQKQFYFAIKKYGWDSFNYYILEEFDEIPSKEFLKEREEFYIKKYNSYHNGYNASEYSSGGFSSEEHKEKCTNVLINLNKNRKNENHPRTDFTKEDILNIFDLAMKGAPEKYVYSLYKDNHNITSASFAQLYAGKHFKDYLPEGWNERPRVFTNAKLWGVDVQNIKKMYLEGKTTEEIYQLYKDKCSKQNLQDIKNNKTYKQIKPCID